MIAWAIYDSALPAQSSLRATKNMIRQNSNKILRRYLIGRNPGCAIVIPLMFLALDAGGINCARYLLQLDLFRCFIPFNPGLR
jgi:hypothetical protein